MGDLQVGILCGVEHDDLKQLIRVSKSIKDAVSLACSIAIDRSCLIG